MVRIRPQTRPDEPLEELIEDPWRTFECLPDPAGCDVSFVDADFVKQKRNSVYYVRAIEAPSMAIHGDPLQCRHDESGRCIEVELCNMTTPHEDDCLGETEERAWSSPIWVDFGA